jgi:AcrR family transcriptional regulator
MSPRKYRLGKRSDESAGTRLRILNAARDRFAREGFHRVSIDEIAEAADVARMTVYNQFGSKSGLVEALIEETEQSAGLEAILTAIDLPDAAEALERTVREGCRYWDSAQELARRLVGLGALDGDVRAVLDRADQRRSELVGRLVYRLNEQDLLASGVSIPHATAILGLLCSFEAFDQMATVQGHSARDTASLLSQMATSMLLNA